MTWRDWLAIGGDPDNDADRLSSTHYDENESAAFQPNAAGVPTGETLPKIGSNDNKIYLPRYSHIRVASGVRTPIKAWNEGVMSIWGFQNDSSSGNLVFRAKYVDTSNYYDIRWSRSTANAFDFRILRVKAGSSNTVPTFVASPRAIMPTGIWCQLKIQWRWTTPAKTNIQFKIWADYGDGAGLIEITPVGTGTIDSNPISDSSATTIGFGGLDTGVPSWYGFYDGLRVEKVPSPPL